MDRLEYADWLKALKVGDNVQVAKYPGCFSSNFTVKTVTKTGKIRLDNNELFNQEGEKNTVDGFKRLFPIDSKCF